MDEATPRHIQEIQACEAAILRIRAAIQNNQGDSPDVAADYEMMLRVAHARLMHYARQVEHLGPEAKEEAYEAMVDRLTDDLLKTESFPSMATGFGSYLETMPVRVLQRIRRKYQPADASLTIERLDAQPVGDELALHATVADPRAEWPFESLAEREVLATALARLPDGDRRVFLLRMEGWDNNSIAARLGVSPATATRIYQRAADALRRFLDIPEE